MSEGKRTGEDDEDNRQCQRPKHGIPASSPGLRSQRCREHQPEAAGNYESGSKWILRDVFAIEYKQHHKYRGKVNALRRDKRENQCRLGR